MVEIQIHPVQWEQMKLSLAHIKNGVPKVLVPSINRALASGRTVVKREIRETYTIKAKDIPVAMNKATYANATGNIEVKQGMLGLDKFRVRPSGFSSGRTGKKQRPIFAQVKKGKGGIIKSAFWIPQGGPYSRIGPSRFPIFKIATISAAIMASQPTVGPKVNRKMGEVLDKRLVHEMNRILAGAKKP